MEHSRGHVFISYARSDGESAAREFHRRLQEEAGIDCWRDRLELQAGDGFWRQLEAGIRDARWLLIVLTPGSVGSHWTLTEWREARRRGVPVCLVWPGTGGALDECLRTISIPGAIRRSHIYRPLPSSEADAERASEEWRSMIATLRRTRPLAPVPHSAPSPPPDYVERPSETARLLDLLLSRPAARPVAIGTALRGAGGMGKTTLAMAVAHRDEVIDEFSDGIVWLTVGLSPIRSRC